jgi:predicted dehydrogenase
MLRFGVVGTGLIASVTARAIVAADGAALAAVSSRDAGRAARFAAEHGAGRAFGDWRDLLACGEIDAVYVATPTAAREAICLAAAQAGKHVLGDKPFAGAASAAAIATACRAAGVAFMDATHFTHHARTALLRETLARRIGRVQAVRASFFFPNDDRRNIRFDPAQEPTGAIGDMAWYCMRALVEYAAESPLAATHGFLQVDAATGAAVRGAGVLALEDGCTLTWDAGYTTGACAMDLHLLGTHGEIWLDDFVLDWAQAFPTAAPQREAVFHERRGVAGPEAYASTALAASGAPQAVRMIEHFCALAAAPRGEASRAAMQRAERTQALVDAAWASLQRR